ncbi:alcohol dehydrogenase [compost metagenome]
MKAIVYQRYGTPEVLDVQVVTKPTPKDDEVLIRTYATTVTQADRRVRSLDVPVGFGVIARLMFGWSKPKQPILGTELSGVVEAIGKDVRAFKVGDHVFAAVGAGMGCHAEYRCMPAAGAMAIKPTNLTHEEAASLSFGGTTALEFFRKGKLQRGERVLVNGASGAVGTAAVQLARHFGADVTGVCSTDNVALVRSLGAHRVIDYTQEDFTANGETYDVIIDTVGNARYARCKGSLTPRGRMLLVFAGLPDMLVTPLKAAMTSSHRVVAMSAVPHVEDVRLLAQLVESGEFKPVVDRCFPFEEMVEAHRYVETGRKRGNVVVTLGNSASADEGF